MQNLCKTQHVVMICPTYDTVKFKFLRTHHLFFNWAKEFSILTRPCRRVLSNASSYMFHDPLEFYAFIVFNSGGSTESPTTYGSTVSLLMTTLSSCKNPLHINFMYKLDARRWGVSWVPASASTATSQKFKSLSHTAYNRILWWSWQFQ